MRRHQPHRTRKRTCSLHVERLEQRDTPATAAPGLEVATYFTYTAPAVNGPTDIVLGQGGLFSDDLYFVDNSARRLYRLNDANSDHDASDVGEATLLYQFPLGSVDRPGNLIFGNGVGAWGNELYMVDDGPNLLFRVSDNTGSFVISTFANFNIFGIPTPTGVTYTPDGQSLLVSDAQNFTVFGGGNDGRVYKVSQTGALTLWATGGNLPNGLWDNNSAAALTSDGWFTVGHNSIGVAGGAGQIVQFRDNNADGDALDAGEGRVLVGTNVPTLNKKLFALDAHDVLYAPGANKVFRLEDLNHDGDYYDTAAGAFDAGESTVVLDNIVGGVSSLRVGPDGVLYVGVRESATQGVVYRLADGQAPAAPTTPDLDPATDTGTADFDNVTADDTPTFTGTAEPGSTVKLFSDSASQIGSATANAIGLWSITASSLAGGTHLITATATDAAGNVSDASAALTVTIDLLTPASPVITSPADGASVDDTTPTFAGTAEPGAVIELFAGAASLGTTTADNDGAWSFTAGELPEGAYIVTATATDAAGNTSSASAAVNVAIDLNDPPAANAGGPYTVPEGSSTTLDGTGSADTDGVIVSYEWDFDYDGVIFDVDAIGPAPTFDAAGLDGPSQRTLAVRVTDDNDAAAIATATLDVTNAAPAVEADNASVTMDEGQTASNTGTFADAGVDDVTISASVGVVSQAGTQSGTWSWSLGTSDGPDDSQTVTITAIDSDGDSTSVTFDLIVANVPPSIDAVTDDGPRNVGSPITISVAASDPAGANDPLTYEFDFDNDLVYEVTNATGVAQHAYASAGAKHVNLRVTDGDGGEATATHVVQVIQGGVQNVEIDVSAGSINLGSNGAIAVRLITTPQFDAAQVDLTSVLFAGAAAFQSAFDDLDGDGDLDAIFHFRRQDTNLLDAYAALLADADQTIDGALDSGISNHQLASVMLTGRTLTGEEFQGIDDDVSVFLAGKQLREFLAALAAAGLI